MRNRRAPAVFLTLAGFSNESFGYFLTDNQDGTVKVVKANNYDPSRNEILAFPSNALEFLPEIPTGSTDFIWGDHAGYDDRAQVYMFHSDGSNSYGLQHWVGLSSIIQWVIEYG